MWGQRQPWAEETPVRCHPWAKFSSGRMAVAYATVLGVIGAVPLAVVLWLIRVIPPATSGDWAAALSLAVFVGGGALLPAAWCVTYQCRATVVADDWGLRWRGVGRWRSAAWEDVTDYHRQRNADGKTVYLTIETGRGRLRIVETAWTQADDLREIVARRATAARARCWDVRGERPEDWPRVFHYDTRFNRVAPRELIYWHAVTLAAVLAWFAYAALTHRPLPGWGWLLTPTGLFLGAKEIALAAMHVRARETHRRLGEQITVFEDGLVFEDETRRMETDWGGIADFYTVWRRTGVRHVIVTAQGEFDFLATLTDSELLRRIVARRAKDGAWSTWRNEWASEVRAEA